MFLFVNWESHFPIDINRVVSRHADSMRSTAAAAATDHRFRSEKISEASAAGIRQILNHGYLMDLPLHPPSSSGKYWCMEIPY